MIQVIEFEFNFLKFKQLNIINVTMCISLGEKSEARLYQC